MTDHLQAVLQKVAQLSPQGQDAIADLILEELKNYQDESQEAQLAPRIAGLYAGQGWMSDDFAEPLPDSFWENSDDLLTR